MSKLSKKVAAAYMDQIGMPRVAGEIRFIKDNGPEGRLIPTEYKFNAKAKKPLVKVLWSVSCAMGHLVSAYSSFTKVKSVSISPDGKLGGKGYIQDIKEMRKNLNATIETLSGIQDTINDEVHGAHWESVMKALPEKEQKEVEEMMSDSEDITQDPEAFVGDEYKHQVEDDVKKSK